ncbi:hypothetical protein [Mangrovivirga cuniculi]|uniref:Uncharacterized protein n=1 Tax=Mangrovivirga cuniculi TaxID=2715131 RepID=A0A4D7JTW7_9BACT|nr:hypothetical protein [Mangrovivirga cuniculi]QCK15616.1 hypothetical protein DCC35_13110 [Mangrovivirga cuniculi]
MKKYNPDRLVSVTAIIVSVGTLFMILYQTNLMRKEQKASVMPSLMIGYSVNQNDDELTEKIWLANRGLGPAFIEKVAVIDEDKVYETDPYGYLYETNANENTVTINRLYPGRIIPANDGIELYVKGTNANSKIVLSDLFEFPYDIENMPSDNDNKVVVEITYKNIYDDKWTIRSDMTSPLVMD